MDNNATTAELQYLDEALFLAQFYGRMLKDRDRLKAMLEGSWEYTIDDAIAEMDSITVSYDHERVQSSNISNPVERIVMKAADPVFMARKQREKDQQRSWCEKEYQYTLWKIGLVESAMREGMDKRTRGIFKRAFVDGWTYEHMRKSYTGSLYDWQIAKAKEQSVKAIHDQILIVRSFEPDSMYVRKLTKEVQECFEMEDNHGKTEENPTEG